MAIIYLTYHAALVKKSRYLARNAQWISPTQSLPTQIERVSILKLCAGLQARSALGVVGNSKKLEGKSTRPGVYKCRDCRKPFSVTVGTVFERSKIPLNTWVLATHLLSSPKKGMSAHQLHRMLGVTYKTAWFMAHRIREAMRDKNDTDIFGGGGLGGENKVVEADETYVG